MKIRGRRSRWRSTTAAGLLLLALALPAAAEDKTPETAAKKGRWRIEFGGGGAIDVGSSPDRNDDYFLLGSIEYEHPVWERGTVGWLSYPLFVYKEKTNGNPGRSDQTIYGVATGIALRYYQSPRLEGFYGEIGSALLWQSDKFFRNDSRINFLSNIGIGYKFEGNWHVSLRYQHISNAGLANPNDGVNALALLFGVSL